MILGFKPVIKGFWQQKGCNSSELTAAPWTAEPPEPPAVAWSHASVCANGSKLSRAQQEGINFVSSQHDTGTVHHESTPSTFGTPPQQVLYLGSSHPSESFVLK